MTIAELKRALVEVRNMCEETRWCNSDTTCPFWCERTRSCSLDHRYPEDWDVDDWKEDAQDATQGSDQAE